ncbi:exodeoxyribonuclease III [Methylobacterium sp. 1030]|uniref:exodeoxyribonuclease III n=1 Tax=Methylobacterium sp. 1030 TaxID=3156404 RepID=UPI0033927935
MTGRRPPGTRSFRPRDVDGESVQAEEGRGRQLALVGDFNVAHTETDLANPRANRCNAGFLPEERAWVDRLLASGFVNAFGQFEPAGGHYTWYSMRPTVRERKVGWRLDYAFVDPTRQGSLAACRHLTERTGSDHCPVEVEFKTSSKEAAP